MSKNVILKRNVFWSMLEYELPIPLESQRIYEAVTGKDLDVGGRHDVKLIIGGKMYDAYFRNEGFDRNTFDHSDIVMLKYGAEVRRLLKEIFSVSYSEMLQYRNQIIAEQEASGVRRRITLKDYDNPDEYIVLSATSNPDVFSLDCVTKSVNDEAREQITLMNEEEFEGKLNLKWHDANTGYRYSEGILKIRQLDRSIGDSLKRLYGYRCQMTGEYIGQEQGVFVVEAHHIDPFTKSMNNDTSNILILSPNYHRIVHKANPEFRRSDLSFVFPNGLTEKVKLNLHL